MVEKMKDEKDYAFSFDGEMFEESFSNIDETIDFVKEEYPDFEAYWRKKQGAESTQSPHPETSPTAILARENQKEPIPNRKRSVLQAGGFS